MNLRQKIDAADAVNRDALKQRFASACTANACDQGRKPCPCPAACRVPAEELEDVAASLWFWAVLGVALVGAGFLLAGGVNLLLDIVRGAL